MNIYMHGCFYFVTAPTARKGMGPACGSNDCFPRSVRGTVLCAKKHDGSHHISSDLFTQPLKHSSCTMQNKAI